MVWFQCEDCGENLKKPKLQSHFRTCSAEKLSCIDCGVIFNQQSVQNHTQCVSEAEKYGPKIVGSVKEALKPKPKEQNLDESGLDTSVGLSTRAPWSCSLCNIKATSQETILIHSQGKKHRSKARAMSTKLPTESASESTHGNGAATVERVPPVLHNNSIRLGVGSAFEIQNKVPEGNGNPDSEIEQLCKENLSKFSDQKSHKEASGLNNSAFLHLCDTNGISVDQEKERRRKKRKVSNDCLKSNDFKQSDKKCKKDGEDVRRRVDSTSVVNQEKIQKMHVELSSKGCSFKQGPSAIASDRGSRKTLENNELLTGEKSIRKKMGRPLESFEHEGSFVSWEDLKDVGGGLVNLTEDNRSAESTKCLAYRHTQDPSHERWSKLVKWKKLIRRAFKDASNGSLTIKMLRLSVLPHAMKTLEMSGLSPDEKSLRLVLDSKIHTYRKLIIDGKKVSLAKNSNAQ